MGNNEEMQWRNLIVEAQLVEITSNEAEKFMEEWEEIIEEDLWTRELGAF